MFYEAVRKFKKKWQAYGKDWKDVSDHMKDMNCHKDRV